MSNRRATQRSRHAQQPDRARVVALEVLEAIETRDAFANLVLPKALRTEQDRNPRFSFRDAAFTSELVYGTLRQRGYLDTVLSAYCSRPLDQLDPTVLQILRMGAYQLLFMRVPDHAAVAEMVEIARDKTSEGATKLVNAVLRSITRADSEEIGAIFAKISDPTAQLAARTSHPRWIVDAYTDSFAARGEDSATREEALLANNVAPQVNLVARPGLITRDKLVEEVSEVLERDAHPTALSPYGVVIEGGDPAALSSVRAGESAAQDQGSQLAALMLATAPLSGEDSRWLDLCAGPGGKTALLAAVAPPGTQVTANEVNPKRARLVQRSVQSLSNVDIIVSDGRTFSVTEPFDRTLVDAPCSGLGSLRRRPESRWRHQLHDLDELLPLQRDLFETGIRATRPGGVLAWVTCTPTVEETIDQVEYALSSGKVELIDARSVATQIAPEAAWGPSDPSTVSATVAQTIQLWPHRHHSDAMFIALLRRL